MTDINFYSGGHARKVIAETCDSDHDTRWLRIRILEGDREIGTISIFGADTVTNQCGVKSREILETAIQAIEA